MQNAKDSFYMALRTRLVAINPASIVALNSYGHVGDPKISTDHPAFEQSSDAGHFIDECTTLREIGLSLGRILICCVVAGLIAAFPLSIVFGTTFVIAGIAAGFSVIIASTARTSL